MSPALDPAIVRRASEWMARLWSDDVGEADRQACERWRAEHPDHERAWQSLQAFERKLFAARPEAMRQVLLEPAVKRIQARRQVLRGLMLGLGVGGFTYYGSSTDVWLRANADYASTRGEILSIRLEDGTQLVLASASAVDVAYGIDERRILLRAGEVMVTSAPDSVDPSRPLVVHTRNGTMRALGTRFSVRLETPQTQLAVFEGAVEVRAVEAPWHPVRIDAGQGMFFDGGQLDTPQPLADHAGSWTQGMLVAEGMRLDAFLAELGRYRHGLLRCDPQVAALRVTGVFSLHDSDRALASLAASLPVEIRYRTRYWVTVFAR